MIDTEHKPTVFGKRDRDQYDDDLDCEISLAHSKKEITIKRPRFSELNSSVDKIDIA